MLAVFAPQAWLKYQSAQPSSVELTAAEEPVAESLTHTAEDTPVQSVPLTASPIDETFLLPPVVHDPVVENESIEIIPTEADLDPPVEEIPASQVPPAPIAETLETPEFNFDVLMQMRDSLVALVDRLPLPKLPEIVPEKRPQQPEPKKEAPAQVQVHSESDRLAMLDTREPAAADWNERSWPSPSHTEEISSIPNDNVAVEKPIEPSSREVRSILKQTPRIATRVETPTLAPTPAEEPTPAAEPTLADLPKAQLELVPLPPVEAEQQVQTPPREALLRYRPNLLFEELENLSTQALTTEWSEQVRQQVVRLTDDPTTLPSESLSILAKLEKLAEAGRQQASQNRIFYQSASVVPNHFSRWNGGLPIWNAFIRLGCGSKEFHYRCSVDGGCPSGIGSTFQVCFKAQIMGKLGSITCY